MNPDWKSKVPWWAKIAAKLVLARLPIGYRLWKKIGLFEHGHMEDPSYGERVFREHFSRTEELEGMTDFTCLEFGPGDSLFSALLAKAYGAASVWLVDVGDFAERDMTAYRGMAQHLAAKNLPWPPQNALASIDDMLAWCNGRYLTKGLADLKQIPSASVDFMFSQAVLEHVRRREFPDLLAEMRRIIHPDGVCSHRIDLRDHLGGALNNLRFSEKVWESEFFARSGFYTNRLGFNELYALFNKAGFKPEIIDIRFWPSLPTPREAMAPPFNARPEKELLISGFDVVLRPA